MIAKAFFLTKEIRAMRTKSLRDKKSFRDQWHRVMADDGHEYGLPRGGGAAWALCGVCPGAVVTMTSQGWPSRG
jgi:hypothetical protein